ncbi:MAG: hypothetical protein RIS16_442 [Actinomycetota bacterium]
MISVSLRRLIVQHVRDVILLLEITGESIQIKASKKVRFLPAKGLKEVISGARKLGAAPTPPAKAAPAKAVKKVGKAKKVARKGAKKAKKSKRR